MLIFLFALTVFGHAAAKWNYTVTVKTAAIESPGSELNLTVTLEGKGGNQITHVLRREAATVELARRSDRECSWANAMVSTGLSGNVLRQYTTKSYSNPQWMNGNTFAENVALCKEDCESRADCKGLQFSPTSWNHQECFLMDGDATYTRSSWKTQLMTCEEEITEEVTVTASNAWRDDYRCGPSNPNGAGDAAECNPDDPYGYTCCSPYGWCGSSAAHCDCATCVDYAIDDSTPDVETGSGDSADNATVRDCDWSHAQFGMALDGHKLRQYTTKSYSNPQWMNGNTFEENVAMCQSECESDDECMGLNFSPTSWDHQECFLMPGNSTYSRSGWYFTRASCQEEGEDGEGGRNEQIDIGGPLVVDVIGEDGFDSGSLDVFHFDDDIDLGTLKYVTISSGSDNAWQLDWLSVKTDRHFDEHKTRVVYNTETQWLSTDPSDASNDSAVDILELEVQGTETYYLVIETANKTAAGSDNIHLKAIIHGTDDTYTGYLDNPGKDDFVIGENDVFIVPGMAPAGRLECLTLLCWGDDEWEFDWIVVFSVKSYSQPPRVFWNNDTVLSTDPSEGVTEYHVCRNDNQYGSVELV